MDKKKRSPNYTPEEKENLIAIIAKYLDVIECKRTGAIYLKKKQEAWQSIKNEYNSICTTGRRNETMLKHFYNNIKHRTRKESANENKHNYLMTLSEHSIKNEENLIESSQINTDDDKAASENLLNDLKMKWTDEKKNLKKTGGGVFTPTLTDADHQMLSVLDDQIQPDENPFDEAAEYFGEQTSVPNDKPKPQFIRHKLKPKRVPVSKKGVQENLRHSTETLLNIYYKKKIECTYYQKKREIQRIRFEQEKHDLEIQILKKKLAECT